MKAEWPREIKAGSVVVKVYQVNHATAKTGKAYVLAWSTALGRKTQKFADPDAALSEARLKSAQMAAGRVDGAAMSLGDRDELQAARKLADGVPVLAALEEWAKARKLTDGHLITAAEAFAARNVARFERIKVPDAVEAFISAKERSGKQGERTYRAKLKPIAAYFPDAYLDAVSAPQLTAYLEQWQDGATRNDLRKRAGALWRWAQRAGHLPRDLAIEVEHTERATESRNDIGILNAAEFSKLLEFVRKQHPDMLAAVVLAGFCGIRSDEVHGKRQDRSHRQTWEDIRMTEKFVRVTVAKKNTPAWRHVPLCDAAIRWLKLCKARTGPVCAPGALEKLRWLARRAQFNLPENCWRHSFISYRIAVTNGNKPQVATEAGNSVSVIDRRYRVPVTKLEAEAWFSVLPTRKQQTNNEKHKQFPAQGSKNVVT